MLERRDSFRVSAPSISAEIRGIPITVENISSGGARFNLPDNLLGAANLNDCLISIDTLELFIPFKILATDGDTIRVKFIQLSPDNRIRFNHALKQACTVTSFA